MSLMSVNTRSSLNTYRSLRNTYMEMRSRAVSVFCWQDLPPFIDGSLLERKSYCNGAVALVYDSVVNMFKLGSFTALDYIDADLTIPKTIRLVSQGGVYNYNEFVILWDTSSRTMLAPIIIEKCERLVEVQRTIDINIHQQRTPRITIVPEEKVQSIKNLYAQIDNYTDNVIGVSDEFDIQQYTSIMQPAPAIFNELYEYKQSLYSEILNLLGITSVTQQNRERLVVDELRFSNGGTFQSRFNRYNPRVTFVEEFKQKFGNLGVKIPSFSLYDEVIKGLPESEINETDINDIDGGGADNE